MALRFAQVSATDSHAVANQVLILKPMLTQIDWTRPWYASIEHAAERIVGRHDWLAALNERCRELSLVNQRGLPLRFVHHTLLPDDIAYETYINETGQIPTRANLHDVFNALVWLSFPNIKRTLNALQAAQIANHGINQTRGAARDAATIFDENAALLVVTDSTQSRDVVAALHGQHWQRVFVDQRSAFDNHLAVWIFGHALMEKLATPYKAITAHLWVVIAAQEFFSKAPQAQREWLDAHISAQLQSISATHFTTSCFTPLPVLGVPGWWPNQGPAFYDDAAVFRPKK